MNGRKWGMNEDLNNPEVRDRILNKFNRDQLDDVGSVGSAKQQMRVLGEMNDLGQAQEQIIRESDPKVTLY